MKERQRQCTRSPRQRSRQSGPPRSSERDPNWCIAARRRRADERQPARAWSLKRLAHRSFRAGSYGTKLTIRLQFMRSASPGWRELAIRRVLLTVGKSAIRPCGSVSLCKGTIFVVGARFALNYGTGALESRYGLRAAPRTSVRGGPENRVRLVRS